MTGSLIYTCKIGGTAPLKMRWKEDDFVHNGSAVANSLNMGYCKIEFKTEGRGNYQDDATLQYPCVNCLCVEAWLVTLAFDVRENQWQNFPGRKQPAVHVWLNNRTTCVLLFFLNPPESSAAGELSFPLHRVWLQPAGSRTLCSQTSRLSAALQSAVRLTTGACVCSPCFLLWKPSINCCLSNLFVTLLLFRHFPTSIFFLCVCCVFMVSKKFSQLKEKCTFMT